MRGMLTPEIQALAKDFLHREITTTELRLYPYLDFVMKNDQWIDPRKINQDERQVLAILRQEGHIEGGMSGLSMTKEFFDYLNNVLWAGYVCNAYNEVADAFGIKSATG